VVIQRSLDLLSPEELRDAGIAAVQLSHERWIPLALAALVSVAKRRGRRGFTSDDVRAEADRLLVPAPAHHNAWGGLFARAARLGLIVQADRAPRKSTRPDAHAHRNPVWRAA
jgi:hypothetical protein